MTTQARRAAYEDRRWRETLHAGYEYHHERLRCVECGDKVAAIREGKPLCSHCVESAPSLDLR